MHFGIVQEVQFVGLRSRKCMWSGAWASMQVEGGSLSNHEGYWSLVGRCM